MSIITNEFCVYKHTNLINGKCYIGITSKNPYRRWRKDGSGYKSNSYFWNAIQKYGWSNFEHKILYQNLTQEQAEEREIEMIRYFRSNIHDFGYNIENGGHARGKVSESTREKLREAKLGSKLSDETKKKIGLSQKGKPKSEDHKKKIGDGNRGKKVSDKSKEKMRRTNRCISVVCISTMEIYCSVNDASRKTGISDRSIIMCCKGKQKRAGGYEWLYLYDHSDKDGNIFLGAISLGYIVDSDIAC